MLINLTPHTVVLRDAQGADHVVPVSGPPARVATIPGTPEGHPASPVPVYTASQPGDIEGLPEEVADEDLVIVSLFVAQAARLELAWLQRDPVSADERTLHVLERCVAPGTGPSDGAVRWTAEDAPSPAQVGHVRAVTRLVRG